MKVICQECGKELSSYNEPHSYADCGIYHQKRAEEILGFSLALLRDENKTLSERLYAEQTDVLESDAKMQKIFEILNDDKAWHWADIDTRDRIRKCLVPEESKETKK